MFKIQLEFVLSSIISFWYDTLILWGVVISLTALGPHIDKKNTKIVKKCFECFVLCVSFQSNQWNEWKKWSKKKSSKSESGMKGQTFEQRIAFAVHLFREIGKKKWQINK